MHVHKSPQKEAIPALVQGRQGRAQSTGKTLQALNCKAISAEVGLLGRLWMCMSTCIFVSRIARCDMHVHKR